MRFRHLSAIRLLALCLLPLTGAHQATAAEASPAPVRLIVGFAPGGAADTVARLYAEALAQQGVNVIVDNRPGASMRISLEAARRAEPDGTTLLFGASPVFTIFPFTYKNLGYDPMKAFEPVAQLVDIPTSLVTGADQPYNTLTEYVAWAKKHPDQATLGLATQGSSGHLGALALGRDIGVTFTPVAYKGGSPMLVDVAANRTSIGWDATASMVPLYKSGKIKMLAMSGAKRLAQLPEVPTALEQGFNQFENATSFYAVYAPAGTPAPVVRKLEHAFIDAAQNQELVRKITEAGAVIAPATGEQVTRRIRSEQTFWEPIVAQSGISFE